MNVSQHLSTRLSQRDAVSVTNPPPQVEQTSSGLSIVGAWSIVGTLLKGEESNMPFLGVAIFTADRCVATSSTSYAQLVGVWKPLNFTSIQFSLVGPMIGEGAWLGNLYEYAAKVDLSGDGLSFSTPVAVPVRGLDENVISLTWINLVGTRIQVGVPDTLPRQSK